LHAETVSALLERSEQLFNGSPRLDLDLAGVPEGDSAGLALLIEWLRLAKLHRQDLHFANVPTQIAALAKISEVEGLLVNGAAERVAT
jgi:phospholipid transport system transporter-binding protein